MLAEGALTDRRPFRAPHHSASMAALVGGGSSARPGRSFARPSRRAVPRRAARVPAAGARQPAPAAGDRRARHRPRQPARGLSRALPARRGHEPVPLRARDRARLRLPPRAQRPLHRAIPVPRLRPVPRPHGPADRGARRQRGRPDAAAARRRLGRGRRAGRGGARSGRPTIRRARAPRRPDQRGLPGRRAGRGRDARTRPPSRCCAQAADACG